MANLVSPGVSVSVTDETFFISATAKTVPLFFVATANQKTQPGSIKAALGTYESNVVRTVTSIKQSLELYGVPRFVTTGTKQNHGDARNEYGLLALNQYLSVGNKAYVIRANTTTNDLYTAIVPVWTKLMNAASTNFVALANSFIKTYNNQNEFLVGNTGLTGYKVNLTHAETLMLYKQAASEVFQIGPYNKPALSTAFFGTTSLDIYANGFNEATTSTATGLDGQLTSHASASSDNISKSGYQIVQFSPGIADTDKINVGSAGYQKISLGTPIANTSEVTTNKANVGYTMGVKINNGPIRGFSVFDNTNNHLSYSSITAELTTQSTRYQSGYADIMLPLADSLTANTATGLANSVVYYITIVVDGVTYQVPHAATSGEKFSALATSITSMINSGGVRVTISYPNSRAFRISSATTGPTSSVVIDSATNSVILNSLTCSVSDTVLGSDIAEFAVDAVSDELIVSTKTAGSGSTVELINTIDLPTARTATITQSGGANISFRTSDNIPSGITSTTTTALRNSADVFYGLTVRINSVLYPVVFSGSSAQTYDQLKNVIQLAIPAHIATVSVVDTGISIDPIDTASITLLMQSSFIELIGSLQAAVPGTGNIDPMSAKITIDGSVYLITYTPTVASVFSDVISAINTVVSTHGTAAINNGNIAINSASTGVTSSVKIEDGAIPLFKSLDKFSSIAPAVAGTNASWTVAQAQTLFDKWADLFVKSADFYNQTKIGDTNLERYNTISAALKGIINNNKDIRSEQYEYNLVLCPGYSNTADAMNNLVSDIQQEALVIADTPIGSSPSELLNWANNGIVNSRNVAYYYPHGYVTNVDGKQVVASSSGLAATTIAYSDQVAEAWFAPAGTNRGIVTTAVDVGYVDGTLGEDTTFVPVALTQTQRDSLYSSSINPIAVFPDRGIVVWGQKTAQSAASAMDRINVVRLVQYISRKLRKDTMQFIFEPNDALTRKNVKAVADAVLGGILAKRGLYDFATLCDESNNSQTQIDNNELHLSVAIKPIRAVEFIYIPILVKNTNDKITG